MKPYYYVLPARDARGDYWRLFQSTFWRRKVIAEHSDVRVIVDMLDAIKRGQEKPNGGGGE